MAVVGRDRRSKIFLIFSFYFFLFVVHTLQTKDRKNVKAAINKKDEVEVFFPTMEIFLPRQMLIKGKRDESLLMLSFFPHFVFRVFFIKAEGKRNLIDFSQNSSTSRKRDLELTLKGLG